MIIKSVHSLNYLNKLSGRYWSVIKRQPYCACCGIEAHQIRREKYHREISGYHLNVYHINQHGEAILLTIDHIKPRSKGGSNALDNLQTLCVHCNSIKSDREIQNIDLQFDILFRKVYKREARKWLKHGMKLEEFPAQTIMYGNMFSQKTMRSLNQSYIDILRLKNEQLFVAQPNQDARLGVGFVLRPEQMLKSYEIIKQSQFLLNL